MGAERAREKVVAGESRCWLGQGCGKTTCRPVLVRSARLLRGADPAARRGSATMARRGSATEAEVRGQPRIRYISMASLDDVAVSLGGEAAQVSVG
jgi:hypothetical protein